MRITNKITVDLRRAARSITGLSEYQRRFVSLFTEISFILSCNLIFNFQLILLRQNEHASFCYPLLTILINKWNCIIVRTISPPLFFFISMSMRRREKSILPFSFAHYYLLSWKNIRSFHMIAMMVNAQISFSLCIFSCFNKKQKISEKRDKHNLCDICRFFCFCLMLLLQFHFLLLYFTFSSFFFLKWTCITHLRPLYWFRDTARVWEPFSVQKWPWIWYELNFRIWFKIWRSKTDWLGFRNKTYAWNLVSAVSVVILY